MLELLFSLVVHPLSFLLLDQILLLVIPAWFERPAAHVVLAERIATWEKRVTEGPDKSLLNEYAYV